MKWQLAPCKRILHSWPYKVRQNYNRWMAVRHFMTEGSGGMAMQEVIGTANTHTEAMALCEAHRAAI